MKAMLVALPSGIQIKLDKERTMIGRNPDNDVVAGDKHVSRRHCAVVKRGAGYFLEDLKSSNGTFVNGRQIYDPVRLRNNDTISLGQQARAYQFRRYLAFFRKGADFLRQPRNRIIAAAGGVILIGLVLYVLVFQYWGRIDVREGLRRLEQAHGFNVFPRDPEFVSALEKRISLLMSEEAFSATLERRKKFKPMIEGVLSRHRLSEDFSLLVWVESRYEPLARNHRSQAAGMWQLIPSTARGYGLTVDRTTDERLDPERSTEAAARYLKDLLSIFGKDSFLLVAAAYNAGDNAVLYGLRRIHDPVGDRNFWYLYRNDLIPEETKEYVLRVIALIIITDALGA